jgi:predicted HTH transcriptional regulator
MSETMQSVVRSLLAQSRETEWLEFKLNDGREEKIGEYLSALSNSAALHEREAGYIVWGVEDRTRRAGICEEAGTGVDKAIEAIELFQLPAPDFTAPPGSTRVILFAHKQLTKMDAAARTRACYQHCCLCRVPGEKMTNASLRQRLGSDATPSSTSRIIAETVKAGMIKLYDPKARRKNACYVPFWA